MGFIKGHPLLFFVLSLLLIALPGSADSIWSLVEKMEVSHFPVILLTPVTALVAFIILAIIVREIRRPELKIEIDSCSLGNSIIREGQPVLVVELALTLNAKSPPINVTKLQLCIGDEKLELISPTIPIVQEGNKGCYKAKYALPTATIYKVPIDKRNKHRICAVVSGHKWCSKGFSVNSP